jgi:hypothetical protein
MPDEFESLDPKAVAFVRAYSGHVAEVRNFRQMLSYESHRGCALAAAAFLDERLRKLLLASLTEECGNLLLDGSNAPLGTFNARILAAQGLALIPPKAARDLGLIRKVRNEFAHQLDCDTFDVPKVTNLCRELHYCFSNLDAPRTRFTSATIGLLALIDLRIVSCATPVTEEDWTQERAQRHYAVVESIEHAGRITEKSWVESLFGISSSTPFSELLELAVKNGFLESQPPREKLLVLRVLEDLIMERAQAEAEKSGQDA